VGVGFFSQVTSDGTRGRRGEGPEGRSGQSIRLTLVPGKIMEWFILSALTGHVKDNQGIRPSQHEFMKGRSRLTNLISFYDQVTCLRMRERLWMSSA